MKLALVFTHKKVDIIWDALVWQHPFLTSGQHELDFRNSIQKNMVTILVHILKLSALYRNTGLSNCIHGMSNTRYVHVPVKYESFWKRISKKRKQFLEFVFFVGRYFWHLGKMSKFCIVRDEPVLILLVLHAR